MPEPGRVFIAKPVAPVVAATAKLGLPFHQFKFAGVGFESQIVPAQIGRLARGGGPDGAAAAAVGCVDPVVEPVFEAVDPMLLISLVEADQDRFAHVGPAITVGVFRVKNLRRGADEHPLAPDHDAIREINVLQEHRCFVVAAVAVGVFQVFDDAARFVAADARKRIGG